MQNSKEIEAKREREFKQYLEKRHTMALVNLLKNRDFRFYMAELLGYCKTFENAFSEKGNVAAFNNGLQAAGQKIFNDIMLVAPDKYLLMCKEEQDLLAMRNNITIED